MVVVAFIQFFDVCMDIAKSRGPFVPGVLIFGLDLSLRRRSALLRALLDPPSLDRLAVRLQCSPDP
jgi:hypothetical protein